MFIPDMPNVPPQEVPVMVAQASQAKQSAANVNRSIGICAMMSNPSNPSKSNQNYLEPAGEARVYFKVFEHVSRKEGATSVTVLIPPKHGTLENMGSLAYDQFGKVTRDTHENKYSYRPNAGYKGQDKATFQVEKDGYKVRVIYFMHVFGFTISDDIPLLRENCPKGNYWRISLDANDNQTLMIVKNNQGKDHSSFKS